MAEKTALKKNTRRGEQGPRLQEILDVLMQYAAADLSARAEVGADDGILDAIAAGVNMLGEELAERFAEKESLEREIARRGQAERKLRESRARLEDYATATSEWWWETDAKHRFTSFEGGLKEIAGTRSHAMLGKTRIEGRSDAESMEREKWERHLDDLEAHRPFRDFEYQNKYGHENSWLSINGKPFFSEEGEFLGYRGVAVDITGRKLAEVEIARQRRTLESFVLSLPFPAFIKDIDGVYLRCNQAFVDMQDSVSKIEEVIGKTEKEFIASPGLIEQFDAEHKTIIRKGALLSDRLHTTNGQGKPVVMDRVRGPMIDEEGKIFGQFGFSTDVTERVKADAALHKLSLATEQSAAVVMITDAAGTIEYVNPAFSTVSGFSSEEAIGQNPRILNSGLHGPEFYPELWETITSGKVWRSEFCNRRKSGELFWVSGTISPIKDEQNRIVNFVSVSEDISRRKQAEAETALARDYAESITASMRNAVLVIDTDASVKKANPSACHLLGYSEKELSGMPVGKLFAEEVQAISMLMRDHIDRAQIGFIRMDRNGKLLQINRKALEMSRIPRETAFAINALEQPDRALVEVYRQCFKTGESCRYANKTFQFPLIDSTFHLELRAVPVVERDKRVGSLIVLWVDRQLLPDLDLDWWVERLKNYNYGKLFAEEEFFWNAHKTMVTKEGKHIPVSVSGSLMRSQSGEIQGVVLDAKDITRQQRMERELEESEERYRDLFHRAPVMYHSISPTGEILHCNKTELDTLGYAHDEYVGKQLFDFIDPGLREQTRKAFTAGIRQGKIDTETSFLRKNGASMPVSTHAVWQKDEQGRPLFSRTIIIDITERKQLEEAVRVRQEAIESSIGAIAITDMQGRIAQANFAFLSMFGYDTEQEALGKSIEIFWVAPTPAEEIVETVQKEGVWRGERTGFDRDGKQFPLDVQLSIILDTNDEPTGMVCFLNDITERKETEAKMREASKMAALGEFVSGTAHEINNPIGIISGNAQYLLAKLDYDTLKQMDKRDFGNFKESIEMINKHSLRCGEITRKLLEFGRGGQDTAMKPVGLNSVINDVLSILGHQLELSEIKVEKKFGRLPKIDANADQLGQVFMNLLINARAAMSKGGKLGISSMLSISSMLGGGDVVRVEVTDTGEGIPEQIRERIFEPFFTTRKPGEGTGLGLAVSYSIIKAHNGDIRAESIPGGGTRMIIELPVKGG